MRNWWELFINKCPHITAMLKIFWSHIFLFGSPSSQNRAIFETQGIFENVPQLQGTDMMPVFLGSPFFKIWVKFQQ